MKKHTIVLVALQLMLLFNCTFSSGQDLESPLNLYPHQVELNASPPQVSLLPQASGSYNGSYIDANAAYDQNGNLAFFLLDDDLYAANGDYVGALGIGTCNTSLLSETNIVPVPGAPNYYYIIYSRPCMLTNVELLYTKVYCNNNSCSFISNGNVISSNNGGNLLGVAVTTLLSNNTHRMYVASYGYMKKYSITSQGITYDGVIANDVNTPAKFETYQLELSSDNTRLAWGGLNNGNQLNIIELNQNGYSTGTYSILISDANYNPDVIATIYGVEFSYDNSKVYVSISGGTSGSNPEGGLFCYDFNTAIVSGLIYDAYQHTNLQKDMNGHIYAVANNGANLGRITTADNTFTSSYLSISVHSNGSYFANFFSLPDLMDYYQLTADISSTPESCAEMSDGTATVIANGGVPPYSYQWNDPAGQTTPTATNLSSGYYSCQVTDAINNTVPVQVHVVTDPSLFTHIGDWHIYTQETLTQVATIDGNIYIHAGGSLTIAQRAEFNANKGINILSGGTLTLLNSSVVSGLSSCNNNNWNGVVVQDNAVLNLGNNCTISKGDLILKAASSVEIVQKTILMEDNSLIIEHRQKEPLVTGGKFVADASVLTTPAGQTWQGIQVWGDNTAHQFPDQNRDYLQGLLVLKNGATIENAISAVELWKPGDYSKTGGMIFADDAVFRNNAKSLHALYYDNYNPINEAPANYNSYFDNCTFEITAGYPGDAQFVKHVDLARVKGISFRGCDFSLDATANNVSTYNMGIAAYDAGFTANGVCDSQTVPCSSWDEITFDGFYRGIFASNAGSANTFYISHAEFTNNTTGIQVLGVSNFSVTFSEFYIGENTADMDACEGESQWASGIGISTTAGTGFAIEENEFHKATGAPPGTYTGIRVAETNATDEIYLNQFYNLNYGIYAEGKNWEGIDFSEGLSLLCNDFNGSYRDVDVEKNDQYIGGIQSSQGSTTRPAGNDFVNNTGDYKIYNNGNYPVLYYWDANTGTANPVPSYEVGPIATAATNGCSSHYGGTITESIILTDDEKLAVEQEYLTALNDYDNVKTLYDDLKDGGDTEGLIAEVETAWPDDTWELRAELLGKSPHLSTEVLKAAADNTDVLPESVLFEILAANPDELRKEELISYLEDKENPLPQYMIDVLRQVAYGTTYKTALQNQMAESNRLKTRAANDMIRSILNEEVTDYAALRNWLDNRGGINSDRQIVETYLAEGNVNDALALAGMIPELYSLSDYDLAEHTFYMDMLNLRIDLLQQGRRYDELTGEEVAQLETLAQNSQGTAGAQARAILEQDYDQHFCDCLNITANQGFKSTAVDPALLNKAFGADVTVEPNPATEWAAFDYTLPGAGSKALIRITDATGQTIKTVEVTGTQGQYVWDTRRVKPGVYFYTFVVNGTGKTSKLVITK